MSYDFEEALSTEQVAPEDRETPCAFVTGPAGTGKSYNALLSVANDPSWGVLSSTTGVSAINLGAITVNSLLRYATTDSLRDAFLSGRLTRVLHALARQYRWLVVDEMSMGGADALDLWYRGLAEANRFTNVETPMGLMLIADFAQLPPVNERWCFDAACWSRFEAATTRLTKVWRQGDGAFLDALNLIRCGDGAAGAGRLVSAGARFESMLHTEFDGTTILPRNDQVSRYNQMALDRVAGERFRVESRRWGQQRAEWGQSVRTKEWSVPPTTELKQGAYVMLLSNVPDGVGGFEFVNGDCGYINGYYPMEATGHPGIVVKLARNGKVVVVRPIVREFAVSERPDGWSGVTIPKSEDTGGWFPRPHYRAKAKRYVTGQIEYFPVRLAYASTVHRSQSLTLDKVQVDVRHAFIGNPGMLYTALSRVRTAEGLRIVGQPEVLAKRCVVDPRVRRWL